MLLIYTEPGQARARSPRQPARCGRRARHTARHPGRSETHRTIRPCRRCPQRPWLRVGRPPRARRSAGEHRTAAGAAEPPLQLHKSLCCISGGGRARRRRQRRWDGVRSWRTGALVVRRPVLIKRVHPAPKRAPGCAPMRGPPDALRAPRDLCLTPRKIQEPQVVLQLPGIHS